MTYREDITQQTTWNHVRNKLPLTQGQDRGETFPARGRVQDLWAVQVQVWGGCIPVYPG